MNVAVYFSRHSRQQELHTFALLEPYVPGGAIEQSQVGAKHTVEEPREGILCVRGCWQTCQSLPTRKALSLLPWNVIKFPSGRRESLYYPRMSLRREIFCIIFILVRKQICSLHLLRHVENAMENSLPAYLYPLAVRFFSKSFYL